MAKEKLNGQVDCSWWMTPILSPQQFQVVYSTDSTQNLPRDFCLWSPLSPMSSKEHHISFLIMSIRPSFLYYPELAKSLAFSAGHPQHLCPDQRNYHLFCTALFHSTRQLVHGLIQAPGPSNLQYRSTEPLFHTKGCTTLTPKLILMYRDQRRARISICPHQIPSIFFFLHQGILGINPTCLSRIWVFTQSSDPTLLRLHEQ